MHLVDFIFFILLAYLFPKLGFTLSSNHNPAVEGHRGFILTFVYLHYSLRIHIDFENNYQFSATAQAGPSQPPDALQTSRPKEAAVRLRLHQVK